MKPTTRSIPAQLTFQTRVGLAYILRRVTPADVGLLSDFLCRLSGRTRWLRFMTSRPFTSEVARAEIVRMIAGSLGDHVTLIVTESQGGEEAAVAAAELVCDRHGDSGEIAVVVRDDAQRQGIGGFLLGRLVPIAQALGLIHLHGDMLAENYQMRRLVCALGLPTTTTIHAGEMRVIVGVPHSEELLSHSL